MPKSSLHYSRSDFEDMSDSSAENVLLSYLDENRSLVLETLYDFAYTRQEDADNYYEHMYNFLGEYTNTGHDYSVGIIVNGKFQYLELHLD